MLLIKSQIQACKYLPDLWILITYTSKLKWAWQACFLSLTLLIFDFSTGFRFSKIYVYCSVHLCSCSWLYKVEHEWTLKFIFLDYLLTLRFSYIKLFFPYFCVAKTFFIINFALQNWLFFADFFSFNIQTTVVNILTSKIYLP